MLDANLQDVITAAGLDPASLETWFTTDCGDVHRAGLPPDRAFQVWQNLAARADQTGRWPFLAGDAGSTQRIDEAREDDSTPVRQYLDRARSVNVLEWVLNHYDSEEPLDPEIIGRWPRWRARKYELQIPYTRFHDVADPGVFLALLPTPNGWETPAYIKFGLFNAVPPADIHVAFLHHLHEHYGARLVVNEFNMMQLVVDRRPAAKDEAMTLARQTYAWCPDIVDQGVGTIAGLAAALHKSNVWQLWWD